MALKQRQDPTTAEINHDPFRIIWGYPATALMYNNNNNSNNNNALNPLFSYPSNHTIPSNPFVECPFWWQKTQPLDSFHYFSFLCLLFASTYVCAIAFLFLMISHSLPGFRPIPLLIHHFQFRFCLVVGSFSCLVEKASNRWKLTTYTHIYIHKYILHFTFYALLSYYCHLSRLKSSQGHNW